MSKDHNLTKKITIIKILKTEVTKVEKKKEETIQEINMGIESSIVREMTNIQGDNMINHTKKVGINQGLLKMENQVLIKMISMSLQITDLKTITGVEKILKKELKITNTKINTNKESSGHAKKMVKKHTGKIMTEIQSLTLSNTNQNILKSIISHQIHKGIQMIDDHMKSQEKNNIVMIKSADNMRKNLMIIQKSHLNIERTIDIKMIIDIRINLNTETTPGTILNIEMNLDIEMMIETKSFLTKKFPFKVVNLHKRKNHPLLIKQWMFNNSIDTWFRIL